jgi:hypothetical protein
VRRRVSNYAFHALVADVMNPEPERSGPTHLVTGSGSAGLVGDIDCVDMAPVLTLSGTFDSLRRR